MARFCNAACLWLFLSFTPGKTGTGKVLSGADLRRSGGDACEAHNPHSPALTPRMRSLELESESVTVEQNSASHPATWVWQLNACGGGAVRTRPLGEGHPSLLSPRSLGREAHHLAPLGLGWCTAASLRENPQQSSFLGSTLGDSESESHCLGYRHLGGEGWRLHRLAAFLKSVLSAYSCRLWLGKLWQ